MRTVLLIRHAKALNRQTWTGPDEDRPLRKSGHAQARELAERFGDLPILRIRSSPARRCVDTVRPLAEATGRELIVDPTLMEGCHITLPEEAGVHVLCAHGDNIPALLDRLRVRCDQCRKGSVWRLELDARGGVTAAYVPPP